MLESTGKTRREQILGVALSLFRKQGYEGTPMSRVAEGVGISKAGLYHHFRTKEDVLRALLDPLFGRVEDLLEGRGPAPNGSSEQRALLEEYFDLILEDRALVALLASDTAVLSVPDVGERTRGLNDRLLGLVAGSEAGLEGQVGAASALVVLQNAAIRFDRADPGAVREAGLKAALGALGADGS